ncbi:MAG: TraR/DksA family transcriptional regulator [Alphaproteobacteria bacterium]|nr:TraR/DksA family transcriptional regulator [Alphaproteobacteria bacterium]
METDAAADAGKYENRLLARKDELEQLVDATSAERATVELDQQRQGRLSRMDALQAQAMANEAARRRLVELERIDNALKRCAAGDYGYCVACEEPIPAARLDFDPAIATCVNCARGG